MLRIALSLEICTSSVRVMSQMMCIINDSLFWLWFPPWSWSFVLLPLRLKSLTLVRQGGINIAWQSRTRYP